MASMFHAAAPSLHQVLFLLFHHFQRYRTPFTLAVFLDDDLVQVGRRQKESVLILTSSHFSSRLPLTSHQPEPSHMLL